MDQDPLTDLLDGQAAIGCAVGDPHRPKGSTT